MRKMMIAATLLVSPLAQADDCRNNFEAAKQIMDVRQEGLLSVVDMMEIADNHEDERFREQIRALVIMAYEHPRYQTPDNQRQAKIEFANEAYLRCKK